MSNEVRNRFILLSPIGIIGIGYLAARIAAAVLGEWGWMLATPIAWGMFAFMIIRGGGYGSIKRWLSAPQGSWIWSVLAVFVGLMPIYVFVTGWKLFPSAWIVVAWILFALINPLLEEGYWRGLLLDCSAGWAGWLAVLYSSAFFAINHPLTVGVYSIANRHPFVLMSTFIMGIAWSVVYRRTKSLRWTIFAHFLTDMLNLSILAFMNIVVPPSWPMR